MTSTFFCIVRNNAKPRPAVFNIYRAVVAAVCILKQLFADKILAFVRNAACNSPCTVFFKFDFIDFACNVICGGSAETNRSARFLSLSDRSSSISFAISGTAASSRRQKRSNAIRIGSDFRRKYLPCVPFVAAAVQRICLIRKARPALFKAVAFTACDEYNRIAEAYILPFASVKTPHRMML